MSRDRKNCKLLKGFFTRPSGWVIIAFIVGIVFGSIFSKQSHIDFSDEQNLQFFGILGQIGLGGLVSIFTAIIVALRLATNTEKLLSEDGDKKQKREGELRAKAFSVTSAIGSFFVAGFVFGAVITVTIQQDKNICEALIAVIVLSVMLVVYRLVLSYYQKRCRNVQRPPRSSRMLKARHRPQRPRNVSQRTAAAK